MTEKEGQREGGTMEDSLWVFCDCLMSSSDAILMKRLTVAIPSYAYSNKAIETGSTLFLISGLIIDTPRDATK